VAIDAVHEDYTEPLRVTWLCRRCHYRWNNARKRNREPRDEQTEQDTSDRGTACVPARESS